MRVQLTRSSASPPHSPLTRGPLGSPKVFLGVLTVGVALFVVACTHTSAPTSRAQGPLQAFCQPAPQGAASVAILSVEAIGPDGAAFPGVSISVSGPQREGREPIKWYTGNQSLSQPLEPGAWQIVASYPGLATQTGSVWLTAGQACTLRVSMDWDRSKWVSVE